MSYRQPTTIGDTSGAKAGAKVLEEIVEGANKAGKPPKKKKEEEEIKEVAQDLTTDDSGNIVPIDPLNDVTNKPFYETGGPINDPYFYVNPITEEATVNPDDIETTLLQNLQ
jgi:hypothetical protein